MNVSIAADNWSYTAGDRVELDHPLAEAWLSCGHALPIKGEQPDETELSPGVGYKGFGNFDVEGRLVRGKKEANELRKYLETMGFVEAGEVADAQGDNAAIDGADNAPGGESPSEG